MTKVEALKFLLRDAQKESYNAAIVKRSIRIAKVLGVTADEILYEVNDFDKGWVEKFLAKKEKPVVTA